MKFFRFYPPRNRQKSKFGSNENEDESGTKSESDFQIAPFFLLRRRRRRRRRCRQRRHWEARMTPGGTIESQQTSRPDLDFDS